MIRTSKSQVRGLFNCPSKKSFKPVQILHRAILKYHEHSCKLMLVPLVDTRVSEIHFFFGFFIFQWKIWKRNKETRLTSFPQAKNDFEDIHSEVVDFRLFDKRLRFFTCLKVDNVLRYQYSVSTCANEESNSQILFPGIIQNTVPTTMRYNRKIRFKN